MMPHTFRVVSGSLVMALALSLAGPGSRGMASAEEGEPLPDPNAIAEHFATAYGAEEGLPVTGDVGPRGDVAILDSPSQVTISLDPAAGATIVDEQGNEFTVAPVVAESGTVGLAGDHVVAYDTQPGDELVVDLATRATSDGGVEATQVVDAGTRQVQWTVTSTDTDAGLVALENGTVALVDPGGVVDQEVAAAAADLIAAEEESIGASLEAVTATVVVERLVDLATSSAETVPLEDDPIASQVVDDVPSDAEIVDDDGTLPLYLQDDPDPVALEAEVATMMAGVAPGDVDEADSEILEFAESAVDAAEATQAAVEVAGDAAVEAAMIEESNEMLAEERDQLLVDSVEAEMSAELDIADGDAEIDRAAAALVSAQAEVGDEGRVLGVFAAPMSKTLDGEPVSTTLEVVDDEMVAVNLPDIGEPVVVDPFFIPVAIFVVRTVAQIAVRQAIKAAAQYAARQAAIRAAAQQVARIAARRAAELARQQAMRASARAYAQQQRIAALRAQAQVASRIAARRAQQQAAANAQRLAAQAQRAKDLAAKAARAARDKAAKAKQDLAARGQQAAQATRKSVGRAVQRAVDVKKAVVQGAAKGVQTAKQSVDQAVRRITDSVSRTFSRATSPAGREFAKRYLQEPAFEGAKAALLDEASGLYARHNNGSDDDELGDCYSLLLTATAHMGPVTLGGQLAAGLFDAKDVLGCVLNMQSVGDHSALDAEGGLPVAEDDNGGNMPWADDLGATARAAYAQTEDAASERAVVFERAPAGARVGADVLEVVMPEEIRAGTRAYTMVVIENTGPSLGLDATYIQAADPIPWLSAGARDVAGSQLTLVDENGDGVWSFGESVAALVELDIPLVESQVLAIPFEVVSGGNPVPGSGGELALSIAGPEAPGAPTLTVTSGKNGQAPMTWTVPSSDPAAPTTGYQIQRTDTSEGRTVATTSYTWAGLTNGTTYSFRVRACSTIGCGTWSAAKSAKPYTVPSTVGKPSISSQNNALQTSWSSPSSGGSTITKYEISGDGSGSTTSRSWSHKTGQSATARHYRVRACNAAGCGSWSAYSNYLRPKVILLAKGAAAPYGYHYDTKVYGPAGWVTTLECHGPSSGAWWSQKVTLNSDGYYRDSTLCYSGYSGGHWAVAGTLKSNTVTW